MSIYDTLNDKQKEAVIYTDGPLLILAGAGSGKTRVLTHRVAYLIGEKKVSPYNIMAITFTNKAAQEMRERVDKLVDFGSDQVWVATFHSSCVRILRRFIDRIGYDSNFTIYDSDDQKTLVKKIFKQLQIDNKQIKEKTVIRAISACKDELKTPAEYAREAMDYYEKRTSDVYTEYQKALKNNNALDFDDLIVKTVELFEKCPEVLEYYQEKFKYIMVDEYQDTNNAQFRLVELLAKKYKNLCVVGDDDQSIYKFRGANIENILNFEAAFHGAKVIKLEQNYRSTANILNAANGVIHHNTERKDKSLWTLQDDGDKVVLHQFDSAEQEALEVIKDIILKVKDGDYNKFAILYRTNAQSRLLEERCVARGIPYQLIGGVNFYQRKEIKDIISYLKTISNGKDDIALLRIINTPRRGIGLTSITKVTIFARENSLSLYDACLMAGQVPGIGKAADKIRAFTDIIENYRSRNTSGNQVSELIESILEDTGYRKELEAEGEIESTLRFENIEELKNKAISFEEEYVQGNYDVDIPEDEVLANEGDKKASVLNLFLENVALVAGIDRFDEKESRITLMTLHSAKGLEFPYVYLAGMEDGLFPSNISINSEDKSDIEEERRLCYVGITRAREQLVMTAARTRMINGETRWSKLSRFIDEIPNNLIDKHVIESNKNSSSRQDDSGDGMPWDKPDKPQSVSSFGRNHTSALQTFVKALAVEKADKLNYEKGDRVKHFKFGQGTVLNIIDGGKDYEVTVDFDKVGIKKMFAGFAKLQKV